MFRKALLFKREAEEEKVLHKRRSQVCIFSRVCLVHAAREGFCVLRSVTILPLKCSMFQKGDSLVFILYTVVFTPETVP